MNTNKLTSYFPYKSKKLPYATAALEGVGGQIKKIPADFRVEEIPLYPAQGEGTHLYFLLTKRGLPTEAAIKKIARELGRQPKEFGFAGHKDARATTIQRASIEHVEPEQLEELEFEGMEVEPLDYHRNKLRPGHHAGNRFQIKIKDVEPAAKEKAKKITEQLEKSGVPNYYGPQRFGQRGDSAILGECLLKDKLEEFVNLYLGHSLKDDPPAVKQARDLFDSGDYESPFDYWPYSHQNRRNCLAAFKNTKNPKVVVGQVPKRLRRLFVSAFQSQIFNELLAERIESIDQLREGDVAKKHDTGGRFRVEDVEREQPRANNFEISPTGPIPGGDLFLPTGAPGEIEQRVLKKFQFEPKLHNRAGTLKVEGTRRFLRFKLEELALKPDANSNQLTIEFAAPPGSYATALLREVMKVELT